MHSFYKFACLTLGLGLVGACDPEPTDPRDVVEGPVVCGGFGGLECPEGLLCVDDPNDDADFYRGKLQACHYFFKWELPKVQPQLDLLQSLDTTTLDMQDAWF